MIKRVLIVLVIAGLAFCLGIILAVAQTAAPTAKILTPAPNSTISGDNVNVTVSFASNSDKPIVRVEAYVDGLLCGKNELQIPQTTGTVTFLWDTMLYSNAAHTLMAKAYDSAGNPGTDEISVIISNAIVDTTPPSINIYKPLEGATVSGKVEVAARATDDRGVNYVVFWVNDDFKALMNRPPYIYPWNTTRYANGPHRLLAWAYDLAGNKGVSPTIHVLVNNITGFTQAAPEAELKIPEEKPAAEEKTTPEPIISKTEEKPKPAEAEIKVAVLAEELTIGAQPAGAPKSSAPQPTKPKVSKTAPEPGVVTPGVEKPQVDKEVKIGAPKTQPKISAPATTKPAVSKAQPEKIVVTPGIKMPEVSKEVELGKPKAELIVSAPIETKPTLAKAKPQPPAVASGIEKPKVTKEVELAKAEPKMTKPATKKKTVSVAAKPAVTTPIIKPRQPVCHVVQGGEQLINIAKRYGVRVKDIVKANDLKDSDAIKAGQSISIPKATYHQVKPGECIYQIARAYGVEPASIVQANTIQNENLLPAGTQLIIPAPPVDVLYNNQILKFEVPPFIKAGISFGAFRDIFEHAGGVVMWMPVEKEVKARNGEKFIQLKIGNPQALVNQDMVLLEVAPFLYYQRTFVPLRFFRVALDSDVRWDPETGSIYITAKE